MKNLPTITEIFFGKENPATFVPWYSDSAKAVKKVATKIKKKMTIAPTKSTTNMS
jgi:hypothetical protein